MKIEGLVVQVGTLPQEIQHMQFCLQKIDREQFNETTLQEIMPDALLLCSDLGANGVLALLEIVNQSAMTGLPVIVLDDGYHDELEYTVLQKGAADYLAAPFRDEILLWRVMGAVRRYKQYRQLQREVVEKNKELDHLVIQTLSAIANLVDSKDRYLKGHSVRVAAYARAIAEKLHKNEKEQQEIYYMGLLHDIGKIGIPDTLLMKKGRLTDSEYSVVQQHTVIGEELLRDFTVMPLASFVAGYHHERVNGTGYHKGLRGDEIPLTVKIVNIADAYDAMSTNRSYREKLSKEEIRRELERQRNEQFDSQMVDVMLELMEEDFTPQPILDMDSFSVSSLAGEGNALLQRLFLEYTEEIKALSSRDSLTGLWNRGYLESQIDAFLHSKRHTGAFVIMDLDHFKDVNDNYGHLAGDRLLIKFGAILQNLSREEDIVSRLGGDEFVVFLKDLDDTTVIQRKVELYMRTFSEKILEPKGYTTISISAGIALAPQHGNTFLELYRNADGALYYVKKHGRNGYKVYENGMTVCKGER